MSRTTVNYFICSAFAVVLLTACGALAPTDPTPTAIPNNRAWTPQIHVIDGVEMSYVPPGCFTMGDTDGRRDERPAHRLCFTRGIWIDVYEVTNARYGVDGPYSGSARPHSNLTWMEAYQFCSAQGGRLPTEAEWEYAARGPNGWTYPWGNVFVETAFNNDRRNLEPSDVGRFPAGRSWVGAHDLSGNVWEWTSSLYAAYPYDAADGREDITQPGKRVFRGGWLTYQDGGASAAMRFRLEQDGRDWRLGFRCARDEG